MEPHYGTYGNKEIEGIFEKELCAKVKMKQKIEELLRITALHHWNQWITIKRKCFVTVASPLKQQINLKTED